MKRYTEDIQQEIKEAAEAALKIALDAKKMLESLQAEIRAMAEGLPVPDNVTPITKKSKKTTADSTQEVEAKDDKAASSDQLPEDTDELREQVRNLVAHLMHEGHRDNAKAMVRRVAGERKLPQIEDHQSLVKLHKLLSDFIRENDLPAMGGAQA